MAETISLRAYLGKVEDLLSVGQTDEAIHHSRHILQYFPRNVAAYGLLGRALLQKARWDEARAVFQRILSARPYDFDAHLGLSEVYERKGQTNDSIWHLERAFEQRPADRAVIDRLRETYRLHRNVNQTRMQLTTAAVARQQTAAGFNDRALDTLRTVLSRTPDRIDLRLLLAQTLWNNDQHVEAAETALDVLEQLPDCIDANAIMTQLWLTEDRPSDAQRFLNRLEATDPYLALELVQGQAAPDESFMLDELDYRRYAQREMATSRPDWLEGLDTTEFSRDTFGDNSARSATTSMTDRLRGAVPAPAASSDEDDGEWPDLFSALNDAAPSTEPPRALPTTAELFGENFRTPPAKPAPSTEDLFGGLTDFGNKAPARPGPKTDDLFGGFTDSLNQSAAQTGPTTDELFGGFADTSPAKSGPSTDDLFGSFPADFGTQTPAKSGASASDLFGEMPDDWSSEWSPSGSDDGDDSMFAPPRNTGDLFGAPEPPAPTPAKSEVKQSGRLFDYEDPMEAPEPPKALEGRSTATGALPDWLQNTEETISPASKTSGLREVRPADDGAWIYDNGDPNLQTFMDEDEPITIPPENIDPMAWLRDSGAEIDEEGQRVRPTMYDDGGDGGIIADPSADPLSWIKGSGIELEEQVPDSLGGGNSGDLEWMNSKSLPDVDLEAAAIEARGGSDVDFFTWLEQQQQSNRVNADDVTIDDDPLEWLSNDDLLAGLDADDDIPGEVDARRPFDRPGQPAGPGTQEPEQPVPAAILRQTQQWDFDPEQLSDIFAPSDQANEAERQTAMADRGDKQGPDWLNNSSDDDLEWLNGANESDANAHLADWLSQGLSDDEDEDQAAPLSDFDWVDTNEASGETSAEPEPSVPDWLSDLGTNYAQPESNLNAPRSETEPEPAQDTPADSPSMPDWLSGLGTNYTQPETLPTFSPADQPQAYDAPLAEPEPAAEPTLAKADWGDEPEEDAQPDWITALDPQTAVSMATVTEEEADDNAAVPAEMPDWMASMQPEQASDTPSWMASVEPEKETPAEPAEVPDWMANMQPEEATDTPSWMADVETAAASADTPEWMNSTQPEAASDTPSWLSSPEPEQASDTPSWMSSSEPEAASEAPSWMSNGQAEQTSDTPSWLSSSEPETTSETPSWLSSSEPETAQDAPSWLSTAEPETPAEQADIPEWMSSMQPEEATNAPSWLSSVEPDDAPVVPGPVDAPESAVAPEPELPTAGSFPDWMASTEPAETGAAVPGEVPDWMANLQPEETSETPSWMSSSEPDAAPDIPATEGMPDWMAGIQPQASSASSLDWLGSTAEQEPAAETPAVHPPETGQMLDWISDPSASIESPVASLFDDMDEDAFTSAPVADVPPSTLEPELPTAGGAADWLSAIGTQSSDANELQWLEGEEPTPAAELPSSQPNASSFDWVNDLAGSDEPESELDDWMASTPSSLSEIAAAEQPPPTDFEWLNAARQDEQAAAQEPAFSVQGADEPETDFSEPDASGGFSWPNNNAAAVASDEPSWLQELNKPVETSPTTETQETPAVQAAPSFSWLDMNESEPEQPAAPTSDADMPEWLRGMQPEPASEPAASVEGLDWLSGIGTHKAQDPEPAAEPEFNFDNATSGLYQDVEEDAMDTPVTSERPEPAVTQLLTTDFVMPTASGESEIVDSVATEHAPAENAPDWLNAMVPGVDLDYAPAEDESAQDTEAITEQPSPTQEFDWLLDIVEEETQPASENEPAPEPAAEPVATQTEAKPRFSFSKLPAWMRKGDDAAAR